MSLPPLAAGVDLATYMQRDIDLAAAELALRSASATVRRWTKQTITFVSDDTITLVGGDKILAMPQRPLVVDDDHPLRVVELLDGTTEQPAVEDRDFTRVGNELTRGQPNYLNTRIAGWPYRRTLGVWTPRVRVTYSHGYVDVPDDVIGVVLDLAAATLNNPDRLRSETVGGESVTYTVETFGTGSLTASHRETLSFLRRQVGSARQS
ncbi:hypothetical protein [Embleya sp. NPDC020630]|uniref:hypothetical protein n=1 Tax=Embleya sp. NPDC020630 TaxID=3363979 RepID=UPI00378EC207